MWKSRTAAFAGLAGATLLMTAARPVDDEGRPIEYPEADVGDVVDDYHGTEVADPYRWMEELDSEPTRAWIDAQVELFDAYIAEVPAREAIEDRLTALWDYEKFGIPFEEGGQYFYSYNSGLQNQNVYYTTRSLGGDARVLVDPNTLSEDGTVALSGLAPSDDGARLAYATSDAGSDWMSWKVRDVGTGEDLEDVIRWSKFSGAEWTPDGTGFFYGRFPEPKEGGDLKAANFNQQVFYHAVGTPQAEDLLVWEDSEHKDWRADVSITDDGEYLLFTLGRGTDDKYRVLYRPFDDKDAEPTHLVGDFDADYTFIDNDGPRLFFRTDKNAPLGKVVAINVNHPEPGAWETIIPEAEETLLGASRIGDKIFAQYLKDARSLVKVHGLDGTFEREVEFPELGTASGFGGDRDDSETFYSFSSFTRPSTIYRFDLASGASTVYKRPEVDFEPDDYTTEQVFYNSKDGTRVPMFISHKKGLEIGPETPTLLYGYGGFNIPLTPGFSPSRLVWMELGGVYAVPNLRGGGEYGEDWHKAGTKLQKQNVFDDFIAAAEFLIDEGRTSTPKLAIQGRSNGGLLVGACMTQRPELFGACLPGVGVLDMLRFHTFTIGWAWTDDYGSSENPDEFEALYAYSPYHNVEGGACYPPTLITTADHDDRVYPAHSFKFAAAMQAAQGCDNPILIRIETRAGHGAGKPTAKIIEEAADEMAFMVDQLGMD